MTNISIALNSANDIYMDATGNLAMVTGADAIAQDCLCAMKGQLGEMVLHPGKGLPYLSAVWLQQNLPQWEAAARATIMAVPGVIKIASFTYSVDGDTLTYLAKIQTIYSAALVKVTDSITGNL